MFALIIHCFYALKELIIENDTITQFAQHWRYLLGNRIHLVITICLKDIEEHTRYTLQEHTCAIKRHDGIIEGGFGRISHYGINLCFLLGYSSFEGRHVMLYFHLVKCRNTIRRLWRFQQRVGWIAC